MNLFVSYFQEVDSVIFCVGMAKVGVEVNFVFSVSDHCWKPKNPSEILKTDPDVI